MSVKKARRKSPSKYERELEKLICKYVEATCDRAWTTQKLSAWAIANGEWEQQRETAARQLARQLAKAAAHTYIPDGKGNQVRKYHAHRIGNGQMMIWSEMKDMSPESMKESANMRRDNLAAGCMQIVLDLSYYNSEYNPGDAIPFNPDFTDDIGEITQPTEYKEPSEDDSPE